jgi:Zn-dependent protease with chaperone function
MSTHRYARLVTALAVATALTTSALAQTKVTPPPNKYSVVEDVKLGQEAAAEARKELPMLNDDRVDDYVERVGERLVAAIPPEYRHAQFRYTFDVVNQKEINAFALPGGPMFLNRGMIEAAKSEAEMAGVMAHEISHVALRHGTAQAGNTTLPGLVGVGGQILGGILGGTLGNVIGLGSQIGAQAWVTRYSREYETQADILGAQILARAGYDPRQMANMFKTIEAQGGGGGPEFLSSHPNPGNRYDAINREAATLRVSNPTVNTPEFTSVKARLTGMSPARTAEQIAQQQRTEVGTAGRTAVRVEPPSNQYRTFTPAQFLRVAVPANWDQRNGQGGGVTYAPDGGWFEGNNGTAFTHGVQVGVLQGGTGNLQRDTEQLIQNFAQGNPNLRRAGNYQRTSVGGRQGVTTALSNVSEVTGQREYVNLSTTYLRDGRLLFVIGVAPQAEANAYASTFARVRQNMQIADR